MKRFLRDTLVFALFAGVAYAVLLVIAGSISPTGPERNLKFHRGSYGHMYTRIGEAERIGAVDVLFVGSSHAYRGFDPRVFTAHGLRSFNLGSTAQTPVQTKLLLERHLDDLRPKLVVMEVFPLTFMDEGVESSLDLISNARIDGNTLCMAWQIPNVATWNTLGYGWWYQTMGLGEGFQEPRERGKDCYIAGGYVEQLPRPFKGSSRRTLETWDPPTLQMEAFQDIVDLLKERGIPIVLVQTPVTAPFRYHGEERERLTTLMRSYAPYYDLSDLIPEAVERTYYYDGHHLMQHGVVQFNERLIALLEQDERLPKPSAEAAH